MKKIFLIILPALVLAGCSGQAPEQVGRPSDYASTLAGALKQADQLSRANDARVAHENAEGELTPPSTGSSPAEKYYSVVKVVDGDTVDVDIEGKVERLRLIGINTPETVDPRKPVECFGREASAKAKEWLEGREVSLEPDPSQAERDKYGRLLRYLKTKDGLFYNLEIIRQGYAYEYTYDVPYKYQQEFKTAQAEARAAGRGLWADGVCGQDNLKP